MATLDLGIDSSEVLKAQAALYDLVEAGKRSEQAAERMGGSFKRATAQMAGDLNEVVRLLQMSVAREEILTRTTGTLATEMQKLGTSSASASTSLAAITANTAAAATAQTTAASSSAAMLKTLTDIGVAGNTTNTSLNQLVNEMATLNARQESSSASSRSMAASMSQVAASTQAMVSHLVALVAALASTSSAANNSGESAKRTASDWTAAATVVVREISGVTSAVNTLVSRQDALVASNAAIETSTARLAASSADSNRYLSQMAGSMQAAEQRERALLDTTNRLDASLVSLNQHAQQANATLSAVSGRMTEVSSNTKASSDSLTRLEVSAQNSNAQLALVVKEMTALNTVQAQSLTQMTAMSSGVTELSVKFTELAAAIRAANQRGGGGGGGPNQNISEMQALLNAIDPVTASVRRLDEMRRRLGEFHAAGALGTAEFERHKLLLDAMQKSLQNTGMSAKAMASNMRGVPAQFTDIVVSLQGGMNPLTVLLQQGGQLKDMFGGVVPALKAMTQYVVGLITPLSVVATGIGAVALAAYQGATEQNQFNQALALTGDYSGLTADQLATMAQRMSEHRGTVGANVDALTALISTGRFTADSMESIGNAIMSANKATGRTVNELIADYVRIADSPLSALEALNKQHHFLTQSLYEQVRALQEDGNATEAARVATLAFAAAQEKASEKAIEHAGYAARAWHAVSEAVKGAWDAIAGIGRTQTDQERVNELNASIERMEKLRNQPGRGIYAAQMDEGIRKVKQERDDLLIIMEGEAAAQRQREQIQRRQTESVAASKRIFTQRQALRSDEKKLADDIADLQRDALLTGENVDAEIAALRKKYADKNKPKVSPVDYTEVKEAKLNLDAIRNEYGRYEKELTAQQAAGLITREDFFTKRRELLEAEAKAVDSAYAAQIGEYGRVNASAKQQVQVNQKITEAESKRSEAAKQYQSDMKILADQESQWRKEQGDAIENYINQLERERQALETSGVRSVAAMSMGGDQAQLYSDMNAAADRFNQERQRLLDLRRTNPSEYTQSDYQRDLDILSQAEDQYAATVVRNYSRMQAANSDWTIGASAALAKYQEQASNVAGQVENIFTNAFNNMEDMLVDFTMTGKLDFKSFAQSVISDIVRMQVRMQMATAMSSVGGMLGLAGSVTGGLSSGVAAPIANAVGGDDVLGSFLSLTGNAKGGAYGLPELSKFSGQVISTPTLFSAYASGGVPSAGLMGEAGAEAILPLKRDSSGDLGVSVSGAKDSGQQVDSQPVVNIHNYNGSSVKTSYSKQDKKFIIDVMLEDVAGEGKFSKMFGQAYGARRKGS